MDELEVAEENLFWYNKIRMENETNRNDPDSILWEVEEPVYLEGGCV